MESYNDPSRTPFLLQNGTYIHSPNSPLSSSSTSRFRLVFAEGNLALPVFPPVVCLSATDLFFVFFACSEINELTTRILLVPSVGDVRPLT